MTFFRFLCVLIVSLSAVACQTTQPALVQTSGAVSIASVDLTVATAKPLDSDIAERLLAFSRYSLKQQSSANGRPVQVKIQVTQFHRKSPAASLLVGDINRLDAHATVLDESGTVIFQRKFVAISGRAINGVAGALLAAAAASDKASTDDSLADDIATQIERAVFGRAMVGKLQIPRGAPLPIDSAIANPS